MTLPMISGTKQHELVYLLSVFFLFRWSIVKFRDDKTLSSIGCKAECGTCFSRMKLVPIGMSLEEKWTLYDNWTFSKVNTFNSFHFDDTKDSC